MECTGCIGMFLAQGPGVEGGALLGGLAEFSSISLFLRFFLFRLFLSLFHSSFKRRRLLDSESDSRVGRAFEVGILRAPKEEGKGKEKEELIRDVIYVYMCDAYDTTLLPLTLESCRLYFIVSIPY